jgi:hypothetical protein
VIIKASGKHFYYKQAMEAQMNDFVIKHMASHLMLQRGCKKNQKERKWEKAKEKDKGI